MTYEVVLTGPAMRGLAKLPPAVGAAVVEFLSGDLRTSPYRVGTPLMEPRLGQFSARRGEYRVIYTIDDHRVVVTVIALKHRRDAYRS